MELKFITIVNINIAKINAGKYLSNHTNIKEVRYNCSVQLFAHRKSMAKVIEGFVKIKIIK